jgi:hypothetical protein
MSPPIDIDADDLRPVTLLARERTGRRPAYSTVWRWRTRGVAGARLECVRYRGLWCSTADAFADFFARRAAAGAESGVTDSQPALAPPRRKSRRRRQPRAPP